ncbi:MULTISPECIES: threonine-phosphate decarboxylase CobD [Halomonadaceae]|uniref:threonine-phosphate decarboxylase CobD n=1 Tax=Halomonadaceae TaxID=28256 RepID=UPI0015986103|nr:MULTISPECIES: threonine-phosphate decarboxylase CobD [Halomonas]QJQ94906.1 threonine-phosphate decarboxylase [Halomonas sp. PA5]
MAKLGETMIDEWPSHGGQPEPLLARFGLASDHELIDFSANINPLGPPAWLSQRASATLDGLARYPDPRYVHARQAIADAESVVVDRVLLTNGGAEAIFLAVALHARRSGPGRAVIIQPTFGEYDRACRHYGLEVRTLALEAPHFSLEEASAIGAMQDAGVVLLCRPNNPTGTLIERDLIERMLQAGREHGCTLVVDEAFVDFLSFEARLTPLLSRYDNLILLRSLTKLYAIPGLRLGYLLANAETVQRAADRQMPWSINSLAADLVAPLLEDRAYVQRTHDWLAAELPRLRQALEEMAFRVVPSQVNFLLFQDARRPQATPRLFEFLLQEGILARHTHNFAGISGAWLRVAVRTRADNARLLMALAAWRSQA